MASLKLWSCLVDCRNLSVKQSALHQPIVGTCYSVTAGPAAQNDGLLLLQKPEQLKRGSTGDH
eukprot:434622-Amphidinium_carterae.1